MYDNSAVHVSYICRIRHHVTWEKIGRRLEEDWKKIGRRLGEDYSFPFFSTDAAKGLFAAIQGYHILVAAPQICDILSVPSYF